MKWRRLLLVLVIIPVLLTVAPANHAHAYSDLKIKYVEADPEELDNLAGVAAYREVEAAYVDKLLNRLIRMTHFTHDKERERVQRVRV